VNGTLSTRIGAPGGGSREAREEGRSVVVHLGEFLAAAVAEEATGLGVTVEELTTFALLYYLADLDGERIARRIPPRTKRENPL